MKTSEYLIGLTAFGSVGAMLGECVCLDWHLESIIPILTGASIGSFLFLFEGDSE
jgi:hypothetical protein